MIKNLITVLFNNNESYAEDKTNIIFIAKYK